MRKRTKSREYALQVLYLVDITKDKWDSALHDFWKTDNFEEEVDEEVKNFTGGLVEGVIENLAVLDKQIAGLATNWELKRMAVVDRNILRLGSYELLFREDIPPKVSINESINLAKKYSSAGSGKFINGILDKINPDKKDKGGT
jgi:transcription antitermination factor NusB